MQSSKGETLAYRNFTQIEAQALVGRSYESLIEFAGVTGGTSGRVPLGTHARVIRSEPSEQGGYDVVLEWLLPPSFGVRQAKLRASFWKDVMERYMQVLP